MSYVPTWLASLPPDLRAQVEASDFVVWSDGSGIYDDGVSAWSSVTFSCLHGLSEMVDIGSETCGNTNRAELRGLLSGLTRVHGCLHRLGLTSPLFSPTVLWIGDRQNLIDAISSPGQRKSDLDLWATVAHFETMCRWRIEARLVSRDIPCPIHEAVDRLASEWRSSLCGFIDRDLFLGLHRSTTRLRPSQS